MTLPKTNRTRGGFTLVELLVVLGIIVVLVALSTAAVQRYRISQQVRSSEDIVLKLQHALDNQMEQIVAQVGKDRRSQTPQFTAMVSFCGGDADRAEALLCYCRLRQAFPQTAAELNQASFTLGGVTFTRPKHFDQLAGVATSNDVHDVSAAILYLLASQTGTGGATFSGQATEGAETEIPLAGLNQPVRVYKDAFNLRVGFYRFGTNQEMQVPPYVNPKPGAASKDPFDPLSKLYNGGLEWINGQLNRTTAQQVLFVNNGDPANATGFSLANRGPVVYSAGKNKRYEQLNNSPNPDGDDLLGYRLRQLGARGYKP